MKKNQWASKFVDENQSLVLYTIKLDVGKFHVLHGNKSMSAVFGFSDAFGRQIPLNDPAEHRFVRRGRDLIRYTITNRNWRCFDLGSMRRKIYCQILNVTIPLRNPIKYLTVSEEFTGLSII